MNTEATVLAIDDEPEVLVTVGRRPRTATPRRLRRGALAAARGEFTYGEFTMTDVVTNVR
jgi:hypothetical protein